jgi:hypothetical protein
MGIPREPFGKLRASPRESLGRRRDYTRAPVTKAYLLGLIHDATERKLTFRIAQKNEGFLHFLAKEISLLGIKAWIYKEGKTRQVWILEFSKKHLTGIKLETKKDKIDYLRGYFDAEGGIAKDPKVRFYLYYCQKNFEEMIQVKSMLEDLKISCGAIHNPNRERDPDFWRFYIRANSYAKFARIVGSLHPDKEPLLRMKI